MNALCTAPSRPVRNPTTRGESCGFVDESFAPARALRAVWTRPWTTRARCPPPFAHTLSRLSPTSSTGPTTGDSQRTTPHNPSPRLPPPTVSRQHSAPHSNRSQYRPRAGSPPTLQAHFRMGLDWALGTGSSGMTNSERHLPISSNIEGVPKASSRPPARSM